MSLWDMICFCGEEVVERSGVLACDNPECDEYLNPVLPINTNVPTEVEEDG